jgi:GTPase SAR1 family protein
MREKDGDRQDQPTEEGKDRITDTAAVPLKTGAMTKENRLGACLPLVGSRPDLNKRELKLLNKIYQIGPRQQQGQNQNQNQNLPQMENQNTNGTPTGLPLVGIETQPLTERNPAAPSPISTDFMIILYWNQNPIS